MATPLLGVGVPCIGVLLDQWVVPEPVRSLQAWHRRPVVHRPLPAPSSRLNNQGFCGARRPPTISGTLVAKRSINRICGRRLRRRCSNSSALLDPLDFLPLLLGEVVHRVDVGVHRRVVEVIVRPSFWCRKTTKRMSHCSLSFLPGFPHSGRRRPRCHS